MAKFTIYPIAQVYSGDNCYVTIAVLIVISQSSYQGCDSSAYTRISAFVVSF